MNIACSRSESSANPDGGFYPVIHGPYPHRRQVYSHSTNKAQTAAQSYSLGHEIAWRQVKEVQWCTSVASSWVIKSVQKRPRCAVDLPEFRDGRSDPMRSFVIDRFDLTHFDTVLAIGNAHQDRV